MDVQLDVEKHNPKDGLIELTAGHVSNAPMLLKLRFVEGLVLSQLSDLTHQGRDNEHTQHTSIHQIVSSQGK